MKIILKENIESLGKAGDTLKVSDGYARNYLIPKGLAIEASMASLKRLEHEKKLILQKAEKEKKKIMSIFDKLKGVVYTIPRRVSENEKIFGSVTPKDIEKAIFEQGIEIDKKMIILEEPIKSIGEFPVKIRLSSNLIAEIKVIVVPEG